MHCVVVLKFNSTKLILSEVQTSGNHFMPDLDCIADVSALPNSFRQSSVRFVRESYMKRRIILMTDYILLKPRAGHFRRIAGHN